MTPPDSDRYRIAHKLGAGGKGAVYMARDTSLARSVAIKFLDDALVDEARGSVLREARAASALNHPCICTVHEVTELDGRPCIVMEHVEGQSLASAIPPGGLPAETVIRYGTQIADALAHAHERGVIHRDLKSANVMITKEGRIKILDFGLAQRRRESERHYATEVDVSVEPNTTSGTLPYMSPELLSGRSPGASDDLWALGVLLYELTTGEMPFRGSTRFELATSIQRDQPAPLPARIPPGLRAVIMRCLARDPGRRYEHAPEVRAALEAVQADLAGTTERSGSVARRRTAILIILLASTLAGTATWMWSRGPAGEPAVVLPARPATIAVLPFENVNNDRNLDHLANGIPQSVINGLARLPGKITVAGWPASQQYSGSTDVTATAGALGVATILRGSVTQAADGVHVKVELLRATDQQPLWQHDYRVADLLGVQRAISTGIAEALDLRLTPDESRALHRDHPATAEAMDLYLRGLEHLSQFTPAGYRRSLDHFRAAIERDETYALAHAGMARVLTSMAYEGLLPSSAFEEAKKSAKTALTLDDTLGAAHDALAHVEFAFHWDPRAAEEQFRQALDLSPKDEVIHRFYAIFLRTERRWPEAIAAMNRALELRRSAEGMKALGATYFWAGQHDKAIQHYLLALEMDKTHAQTLDLLADAYAATGRYADALRARRNYLRYEGAFEAADALGTDATEAGYRRGMARLYRLYLQRLEEAVRKKDAFVSPMEFALTYIALGEHDLAFAALDQAYHARAPWLSSLGADPAFDPIRSDPRFAQLVAKVRVPYRTF